MAFAAFACGSPGPFETILPDDPIEVSLKHGSPREQAAKRQLERVLARYRPSRWLFTRRVIIDQDAIPHSHPVLTLNTRHLDDDERLLTVFIHEQIHWFTVSRWDDGDAAIRELQVHYPVVPDRPPEGARDRESTYLHLLVCTLEYEAALELLGAEAGRAVIERASLDIYRWIYRTVLSDAARIRVVLDRYKLRI